MKIFCSELSLIGGDPLENVQQILQTGIHHVELMLDGKGWNDFHLRMEPLAEGLKKTGAVFSVHTPVWDVNLTSENAHMRQAAMQTYQESIRFAHMLDATHVVIHPGFCYAPVFDKAIARKRAHQSMEDLLAFNQPYNQLLLFENVGTPKTSIFNQQQYASFLDGAPQQAGYLLDVGHAYINGWDIPLLIQQLGSRLHALHLHDNDGQSDAHLPMCSGNIQWKDLFASYSQFPENLSLVLEYNIGTPIEKIKEGKQLLESFMG